MCDVTGICVQRHMLIMCNVCKPVLAVTLLIAVGSFEICILT